MSAGGSVRGAAVQTLFRLDGLRLHGAVRHPAVGPALAVLLPMALLVGILWAVGRATAPVVGNAEAALLLGLLLAGPIAFSTYGTLFRAADEPTLRRLGFPAPVLYVERVTRLLVLSVSVALLGTVPFLAAGEPVARPLAIGLSTALAAWGSGVAAASGSARAVAVPERQGSGVLGVGIWDAEVRAIAPLLYAPLLPFLAGAIAAAYTGAAPGSSWSRVALVAVAAMLITVRARRWHADALPRFAPQALEMSFEPPPAGVGEMSIGRGAGRLLPRGAASVWVRDSLMVNRRFAWAARIVWPVVFLAFVGLARWGGEPATRGWVAAAALLALLAQSFAAIALGRLERTGPRWLDRSLGLTWPHRLLGRWAWGFGASLWLTVPLALSWSWWSGMGGGWLWITAGGATAAAGAVASMTAAGWR